VRLTGSSPYNRFCIESSPKWGFGVILGIGGYLLGKYIRPHNCAFSDIFGLDLTRRVLAFCMSIAIAIGENLCKFGGPQFP